jgi:3D (Asp-Asp-Asp) domain-containing protein
MKNYALRVLTNRQFFANLGQLMKAFLRLVSFIRSAIQFQPRFAFAVGVYLVAPFSGQSVANQFNIATLADTKTAAQVSAPTSVTTSPAPEASLPVIQYKTVPKRRLVGTIFAYSSTVSQTDANPTVTASGLSVTDGTVATNCLPFGTTIRFPSLYGNKEFTVTDRMAARHGCSIFDIWQPTLAEAQQFGRQVVMVEIY